MEKLKQQLEECIKSISENGLCRDEVDYLGKLVDIHKDIENESYWKDKIKLKKEESEMGYGEYGRGEYGRRGGYREGYGRRRRNSRGRYMEGGYGHYMPEEMMEEMMEHYQAYNEASEEYERGNYGAEGGMAKSAEGIMKNVTAIVEELSQADSPEVMEIIQKHAKKIMEIK